MKKLILLVFIIITSNSYSQNRNDNLKISISVAHYSNVEERELVNSFPGYYENSFDPGFELLYNFNIVKRLYLGTGINYQIGRNASYIYALRRFNFSELSIPLVFSFSINPNKRSGILMSGGTYLGKIVKIKTQSPSSGGEWIEGDITKYVENYSDDNTFLDLYTDIGYFHKIFDNDIISITPFMNYRLNTTWLNYHQKNTHIGIKINYLFNLKTLKK
jgi:hypothetical protein